MNPSQATTLANLVFMVCWILAATIIVAFEQRWQRTRNFREKVIGQWKPSLVIALSFEISMVIGGKGILNPYTIAVFCQALIGLALARSIPGFEPLAVTNAIQQREHPWRRVGIMLGVGVLAVVPAMLIGNIGLSIGQQIFHEQNLTSEAMGSFPANKWAAFFLLLAGAGVAEETPYRLVFLSLFWRLTRRRNLAILISAVIFGLYHLTPLTSIYATFWQFPISQFLASTLIGLVWGYLFVKLGYEAVVTGHTFSDWIPFLLFVK